MANKKSKYSVSKVLSKKGNVIGYLSTRDEENGLDARLDLQGYTIVALWNQKKEKILCELEINLSYIDRIYDLENFWISTIAVNG